MSKRLHLDATLVGSAEKRSFSLFTLTFLFLLPLFLAGCRQARAETATTLRFTGFLEAESVILAPEVGGRILELPVAQGAPVHAGQVVARLDDSLIRLQLAQADAQVALAEAELARLKAAVRPEDVALAQAQVAQAQAALDAAEQALQDAKAQRDHPQDLDVQIAQARASLQEAQAYARAAQHQARAADLEAQMWGEIVQDLAAKRTVTLPDGRVITVEAPPEKKQEAHREWNAASQRAWKAWSEAKQAQNAVLQAQSALDDLLKQRQDPQEAQAQVVAAQNARDQAAVALDQARAALEAVQAGPSDEQIAAAEARVDQARAAREAQATALRKTRILAPMDGVLQELFFVQGEVIGPGQQLMRLTRPDHLTLTIYAPAGEIDRFYPDQVLPLLVDSAPGKTYHARVLTISDEPEYTMRQSQDVAERAAVVYAITLQVEDPDDHLRPGLPADVLLRKEEQD